MGHFDIFVSVSNATVRKQKQNKARQEMRVHKSCACVLNGTNRQPAMQGTKKTNYKLWALNTLVVSLTVSS